MHIDSLYHLLEVVALLLQVGAIIFVVFQFRRDLTRSHVGNDMGPMKEVLDAYDRMDWVTALRGLMLWQPDHQNIRGLWPAGRPTDPARAASDARVIAAQHANPQSVVTAWWNASPYHASMPAVVDRWTYLEGPRFVPTIRRAFVCGTILLGSGLLLQLGLALTKPRPVEPPPIAARNVLMAAGQPILFPTGGAELRFMEGDMPRDLVPTVCALKDSLIRAGAQAAVVVGGYDQRALRREVRRRYRTNVALAQHRANAVAAILEGTEYCGTAITPVLRTIAGPGTIDRDTARIVGDRKVEVYGLVAGL